MLRSFLFALVAFFFSCVSAQEPTPEGSFFVPPSDREKNPWTHLKFKDNPEDFQFAIVGDRTGGLRRGVFPKALTRLNLLQPEFVVTVGDVITGNRKSTDAAKLHAEWDEMEGHINKLDMPFFYVPGNHDNGSPLMAKVWRERFGVERYFFVYKNVLFLCLNAQDTEQFTAIIKEDQQTWAKKVLAEHPDVRWTVVFIHQPVWMYEDGVPINEDNRTLPARTTGWKPIEVALAGRKHTVFAGHIHQYIHFRKDANTSYYTLGTTGGGNRLRGPDFGEFDHAMWVTMTDEGPKIANLLIDGILPADVNTEEAEVFRGLVELKAKITKEEPLTIEATLNYSNRFGRLAGHIDWEMERHSGWRATPLVQEVVVEPKGVLKKSFTLVLKGRPEAVNPRPVFHVELEDEDGLRFVARKNLPVDFRDWYTKHDLKPPPLTAFELKLKKQAEQKQKQAERERRLKDR